MTRATQQTFQHTKKKVPLRSGENSKKQLVVRMSFFFDIRYRGILSGVKPYTQMTLVRTPVLVKMEATICIEEVLTLNHFDSRVELVGFV
jgi:hypothetical protein